MFRLPVVSSIRPTNLPTVQTRANTPATTARAQAQKAFFEAALNKTAQTAYAQPQARQPTHNARTADFSAADEPQRFRRPGSIIDIKV